jgi:toxin ParE1/3/4
MKDRPIVRRPVADQDVQDAAGHYLREGGAEVATAFVAELQRAFRHVGRYPATGSERYASELSIAGLRCWPMNRFPYLIFYTGGEDFVDVWRVLHGQRDLAAELVIPASGTAASAASPTPAGRPPGAGGPPPG